MYKYLLIIMLCCSSLALWATHQRAGEITFVHLSGTTYQFTIVTYTYTPSYADRPELEILWGDGGSMIVPRQSKTNLANNISKNVYVATHSFSAAGFYVISVEDPNRNAGILNIPNSVNIPFYLETTLVINPFLGANNSPQLLNPPIDNGCTQVIYYHNPGAYDADGDSLSYSLVTCKGYEGRDIPGYTLPNASNTITINPITGDLVWDSPLMAGEYNIAILIQEWRRGILIGSIIRDMQITISPCNNHPPEIQTITDTCVLAGTTLSFPVTATDPDFDNVHIEAFSSLFSISGSALFNPVSGQAPVTATFSWNTRCDHVKRGAYSVLFKATDNGSPINLVAYKTLNIRIVAPKPENLTATVIGNQILLQWQPSICRNAVGYKVYKRMGAMPFTPNHCQTGLPAELGYVFIGSTSGYLDTAFVDNGSIISVYQGNEYCYRVYAVFADGAESYVSDEVCISLVQDAPLITHVDVDVTHATLGEIIVKWVKPAVMDTVQYPADSCYYKLYRKSSVDISWTLLSTFNSLTDSLFVDTGLNTEQWSYSYQIELYTKSRQLDFLLKTSDPASSLYLTIVAQNATAELSWQEQVPWNNTHYIVYRYNAQTSQFDSIATTFSRYYQDKNLVNGKQYCYYIQSAGGYFVPDTLYPNWNRSQQTCQIPIKTDPPEVPLLTVTTDCKTIDFQWKFSNDTAYREVEVYYIHHKPYHQATYTIIDSFSTAQCSFENNAWTYQLSEISLIAGCFALSSRDSNRNMSAMTTETCFEPTLCLNYVLPNIFTPNGDGINDLFTPFPYTNVVKVKFVVYNRWGGMVYKTENPDLNWDGNNYQTRRMSMDGTYFYVCDVYVTLLNGKETIIPMNGVIMLITETKR